METNTLTPNQLVELLLDAASEKSDHLLLKVKKATEGIENVYLEQDSIHTLVSAFEDELGYLLFYYRMKNTPTSMSFVVETRFALDCSDEDIFREVLTDIGATERDKNSAVRRYGLIDEFSLDIEVVNKDSLMIPPEKKSVHLHVLSQPGWVFVVEEDHHNVVVRVYSLIF